MLFFGALFSAICVGLFFFSASADTARNKSLQEGLIHLQTCFSPKLVEEMTKAFEKMSKPPKSFELYFYTADIIDCLGGANAPPGFRYGSAYNAIRARIDDLNTSQPAKLKEEMTRWLESVSSQPTRLYDFEIPSNIAFDVVGNKITSPITAVLATIKLLMGPVLFFWLTGFLCTRSNELLLAQSAPHHAALFPHIINTFPLISDKPRTKKSPTIRGSALTHAFVRAIVVFTLLLTTVGAYVAALLTSVSDSLEFPLGAALATLFLICPAVGCVLQEFMGPALTIGFFNREQGAEPYKG